MDDKGTTSEKWIEKTLCNEVKKLGGWAIKLPSYLLNGLPDRLILMPQGHAYFAETKSKGGKPSKIQELTINKIKKLGFTVFIIYDKTTLDEAIKTIKKNGIHGEQTTNS